MKRVSKDRVILEAKSTPETMKEWPHQFLLRADIGIKGNDGVSIEFTETNTGKTPFESAFGVHPYFSVEDAEDVALDGAKLPKPWVIKRFAADKRPHRLKDLSAGREYCVTASWADGWTVWNPGVERTPLCEALGKEEWRKFYCLEPVMNKPLKLLPGKSRTHKVKITVRK